MRVISPCKACSSDFVAFLVVVNISGNVALGDLVSLLGRFKGLGDLLMVSPN